MNIEEQLKAVFESDFPETAEVLPLPEVDYLTEYQEELELGK